MMFRMDPQKVQFIFLQRGRYRSQTVCHLFGEVPPAKYLERDRDLLVFQCWSLWSRLQKMIAFHLQVRSSAFHLQGGLCLATGA